MIYLDYSATTPVHSEVLDTFSKVTSDYIGNPNSLHRLGVEAKNLIHAATDQMADLLGIKSNEIIYTSGASEANNAAIMGVVSKYSNRGRHIITTRLEHSSVIAPLSFLEKNGYEVDFVSLDENGLVSFSALEKLIREDTILVSICFVNSEVGMIQNIEEIGKFLKKYPKIIFHSDITQAVGKIKIPFDVLDLASFSAQKFFGMKGIGALYKRDGLVIEPLIHGGKSTTIYRGGTPATALIVSMVKALRLIFTDREKRYLYVSELNSYIEGKLKNIPGVLINSNHLCSPYILNISLSAIKSEVMLHALEEEDIYVSTQTACSKGGESLAVYAITKDHHRASYSLRISLSHLTTKEELDIFLQIFEKKIKELDFCEGH